MTTRQVPNIDSMHHLVGSAEIAAMFGVSRQRVQQLIARRDFPSPEVELAMGKVWQRSAVEQWARARNRIVLDDGDDGE